jgi:hypothetical protein
MISAPTTPSFNLYAPSIVGTFGDASSLVKTDAVAATCEGADCGLITGWGEDFSFPRSAETTVEAESGP